MKLFYLMKFNFQLLFTNKLIPLVYLGLLLYSFIGFYVYSTEGSPGSALTTSSYVVQFGAIAYLLLGIHVVRLADKHNLKELFSSLPNGYLWHQFVSLIVGFLSTIVFVLLTFTFYLIVMWAEIAGNYLFISDVLQYLMLYYGLSFFICYLFGFTLANLIKGKFVLPLALLVYVLITPLNFIFLDKMPSSFGFQWDKLLNIGEPNPTMLFNALYGLSVAPYFWAKQGIFISALFLCLILIFIKQNIFKEKIQILSTLIISSALLLASLFTVITNSQVLNDRDDLNLTEYYRDYQVSHSGIVQPYQIKNMNIHLGTTWGFKADVEFLLKNNGKGSIDELIFSLFHELQVKEILIDGQRTNFTHEGDRLVVQLEKTLNSDDQVNVNIDYKGLNTSFYLANQQAIYLPNYFNWLPSINDKPSFTTVGKAGLLGRVNHQLNQKVSYHLTLQHNGKDVFTNLDQVDDSEWIAENSNGITLISGSLDRFEKNDVAFVLPSTWRDAMNGFETLQTDLISIINLYNDAQLSIENIPVPDKIFFVPNVRVSDGSELQGTWYSDDHLILGINTLLEPKSTFFIDYRESILLAITNGILLQNPYRSNIIDNDFSLLYRAYLTDIIFEQLEYVGVEEFNRTVQFEINDVEQDDKRTAVDYLYAFRENPISDDLNHPFYKEWTKLLELKDPWEELINLLENVGDLH